MGIWNDRMIRRAAADGMISPFDPACVNPASYDLKLGHEVKVTSRVWGRSGHWSIGQRTDWIENPLRPNWDSLSLFDMNPQTLGDGFWLFPGQFILAHSLERLKIPVHVTAFLHTKSSTGRIGLDHCLAGFIDPGFGMNTESGSQLTFEFVNVSPKPILLKPGMRLMQMVLMDMAEPPERPYYETGRYNDQQGATPAREPKGGE